MGVLDATSRPCNLAGQELTLSGCVGACIDPEDSADAKSLVKSADFATYAAKQAGKNRVKHFTPDLGRSAQLPHHHDVLFLSPQPSDPL